MRRLYIFINKIKIFYILSGSFSYSPLKCNFIFKKGEKIYIAYDIVIHKKFF